MITLGLTGGIGAGKSTIARIFHVLGAPVFTSDRAGHEVLQSEEAQAFVTSQWPNLALLDSQGNIDRKAMAQLVFSNEQALAELNRFVHPRVRCAFDQWKHEQDFPYVVNEAAILFETGAYKHFDRTVLVCAPKEERIQRVLQRDGVTRKDIEVRMSRQWTEEKKRKLADYTIENDGSSSVIKQVLAIHQALVSG